MSASRDADARRPQNALRQLEEYVMAFVPLALSDLVPGSVRMAIEIGVEPPLQDVHWMLATNIGTSTDAGPHRQLQLPIALVLLTTVAGVSKWLFHTDKTNDGDSFRECLIRFFPWDIVGAGDMKPQGAASILYKHFRNPLVHELGFHKRSDPTFQLLKPFPGTDDYEKSIEELERLTEEEFAGTFLLVTREKRVLYLREFYWGVRKLVERWSYDETQVLHAEKKLSSARQ